MLPLWASARPLSFPFPPALALRPSAAADPLHFLAFCILFFLLFSPLPSCCSISVTRILWPLTLLTRQMHPPFPLCHHCFLARQDKRSAPSPSDLPQQALGWQDACLCPVQPVWLPGQGPGRERSSASFLPASCLQKMCGAVGCSCLHQMCWVLDRGRTVEHPCVLLFWVHFLGARSSGGRAMMGKVMPMPSHRWDAKETFYLLAFN